MSVGVGVTQTGSESHELEAAVERVEDNLNDRPNQMVVGGAFVHHENIVALAGEDIDRVAEHAMKLPAESRAEFADRLVESPDSKEIGRIDRLWRDKAKRRLDDVRSGRVKTISGEDARRRVRRDI